MEVTGYKLREAVRRQTLRRETAASQFKESLRKFPDEQKTTPDEVIRRVRDAEEAIAALQVAQTRYNLAVRVTVPGKGLVPLLACIKRIGGLGRIEKTWRSAATAKERSLFDDTERTRDPGVVTQERQISFEEASARTEQVDRELAVLREVIAIGNAQSIDIEDLDARLFD